jgi:hypothetical protein
MKKKKECLKNTIDSNDHNKVVECGTEKAIVQCGAEDTLLTATLYRKILCSNCEDNAFEE